MKPLPRQHRIAHLRALIRQWPVQSIQRQQLAMLLRDEFTVWARAGQRFGRYRYLNFTLQGE
jgi:hypothetical protein